MTIVLNKETRPAPKKNFWDARSVLLLILPVLAVFVTTIGIAAAIDSIFYEDLLKNARQESLHNANAAALDISKLYVSSTRISKQADATNISLAPLHKEVRLLSKAMEDRITIVSATGLVLADSDLTPDELKKAVNHAHRPEIDGARLLGHGTDQRVSSTLGAEFIYAAVAVENDMFVRVAQPVTRLIAQRDHIRKLLSLGALLCVLIVSVMSVVFGRQFTKSVAKSQKEKLEFSVNERVAVLGAMQELGSMLAICNSVAEAAEVVEAQIPNLVPGQSGALTLMNNSRNLMVIAHEWGGEWTVGDNIKPDDCWSLRKNEVHFSNNGSLDCKHSTHQDGVRTMCIPLMTQGEILGVIHIRENAEQPFTEDVIEIAKSLGREIATALSNLKLRDKLREQALHDPLTGLHNRRHMEDEFEVITTQATYENKRCSLLLMDVDHFKSYNDQYGHDAGDFVLSQLAKLFRKSISEHDIACRMGGEEFGILLFDADAERATKFANRVREGVEKLGLVYEGRPLGEVTISIGVSSFPDDGIKLTDMLKAADELLYEAKDSGRNCVKYAKAA